MATQHKQRHPNYVDGCQLCKWQSINVGVVTGSHRDRSSGLFKARNREKGLHRYRDLKQAGEQPSGTTLEAQAKDSYKKMLWEKHSDYIEDTNPPDRVASIKKSLVNKE